MSIWLILLIASGIVPLARAIWANRRTTLLHALAWGVVAWAAWLWLAITGTSTAGYFASSLTACAGVAVLGARRPGVGAWNMVVAGLLATLLIPLGQEFLTGNSWLSGQLWYLFRAAVLIVTIMNYAASRAMLGAFALSVACVFESIAKGDYAYYFNFAVFLAGMSLWLAWVPPFWRDRSSNQCDRIWHGFQDRFGAIWALRMKEQFNLAAKNGDIPIVLTLDGLIGISPDEDDRVAAHEILVALMKRFGLP